MIVTLLLIILALLGAPLFAVIAGAALWGYHSGEVDLSAIAIEFYRIAETPVLIAIPLFTFAGYVLSESGAPGRLVRVSQAFLGWLPGGLAFVSLAACALFTAFTGASGATIVALGALLYPALQQAGYPARFSLGLVTAGGSLGMLFAPALPLILYGIVAQQMDAGRGVTIDDLFLAGALPGALQVLMLGGLAIWVHRRAGVKLQGFSWREARLALLECGWEIPLPFVVLGGIYTGYFAVSEAAAVTAIYVVVVEVFIRREVRLIELPQVMRQSMVLVGGIVIILGVALASTNVMIDAGVPERIVAWVTERIDDRTTFLLLLNVFLIAMGMMLEILAIVLVVPLMLPVAVQYGVDPVHFGIILLATLQLGYLLPPVGLNLFVAAYRFQRPVLEVVQACLPFIGILLLSTLLITYWPALSLVLIR
jgi:C4-dicarboxylate transporter DctM subunit